MRNLHFMNRTKNMEANLTGESVKWRSVTLSRCSKCNIDFHGWEGNSGDDDNNGDDAAGDVTGLLAHRTQPGAPVVAMETGEKIEMAQEMRRRAAAALTTTTSLAGKLVRDVASQPVSQTDAAQCCYWCWCCWSTLMTHGIRSDAAAARRRHALATTSTSISYIFGIILHAQQRSGTTFRYR